MTTRHEFLAQLHELLKPRRYLETGVQYGSSLNLAVHSELAIGIDPLPLCQPHGNQQIFPVTADDYFQYYIAMEDWIDFAFIDGSHLFEDALRDFINVEHHGHKGTVVVFDDVLPYNSEIASRNILPGDWTGDVWKTYYIFTLHRPDLGVFLVDTWPTGTMVVHNLDPNDTILPFCYQQLLDEYQTTENVPQEILSRSQAVSPQYVLDHLGAVKQ